MSIIEKNEVCARFQPNFSSAGKPLNFANKRTPVTVVYVDGSNPR
jgi:hypothetical protein